MKRYVIIIAIFIVSILTSVIVDTSAIYTHSDQYTGCFTLLIENILQFELKASTQGEPITNSKVIYDRDKKQFQLQNEAIGGVQFSGKNGNEDYVASVQLRNIKSNELKNLGFYFNADSSYNTSQGTLEKNYGLYGYVLKFDDKGNMSIRLENVRKQFEGDHYIKVWDEAVYLSIPAHKLPTSMVASSLDIKVYVKAVSSTEISCSVYLNDIPVKEGLTLLNGNKNGYYGGRIENQITAAVATNGQNKSLTFQNLKVDSWDGTLPK